MELEINTPQKSIYADRVKMVRLPGTLGPFQILKNHAPIISTLEIGKIKVIDANNRTLFFKITAGIVECLGNKIVVLADSVELES